LAIQCLVKSLRGLPVGNRIDHVTPYKFSDGRISASGKFCSFAKTEFCNTFAPKPDEPLHCSEPSLRANTGSVGPTGCRT